MNEKKWGIAILLYIAFYVVAVLALYNKPDSTKSEMDYMKGFLAAYRWEKGIQKRNEVIDVAKQIIMESRNMRGEKDPRYSIAVEFLLYNGIKAKDVLKGEDEKK